MTEQDKSFDEQAQEAKEAPGEGADRAGEDEQSERAEK